MHAAAGERQQFGAGKTVVVWCEDALRTALVSFPWSELDIEYKIKFR
jgi:hypothetical protein